MPKGVENMLQQEIHQKKIKLSPSCYVLPITVIGGESQREVERLVVTTATSTATYRSGVGYRL